MKIERDIFVGSYTLTQKHDHLYMLYSLGAMHSCHRIIDVRHGNDLPVSGQMALSLAKAGVFPQLHFECYCLV